MSEYERFIVLLRMPNSDRAVLLLTFGLTVLVDLTVAIGVGIEEFIQQAHRAGAKVILSGVQPQPAGMLRRICRDTDSSELVHRRLRESPGFSCTPRPARCLETSGDRTRTPR